jgi:hypothetical protein
MNKFNISHAPSTGLNGTQFSTLDSAGINDPKRPEKYNNTELKYEQLFTAATRHLTPAVIKIWKQSDPSEALNPGTVMSLI